jgi:hypothetical protein
MEEIACTDSPPMAAGRYRHRDGQELLLPFNHSELERAVRAYQYRIGSCGLKSGDVILVISLYDESFQFGAFNTALLDFDFVRVSADASPFDAGRVESIIRQFNPAAVVGINRAVLDGLASLGHDAGALLANRRVWARPDAWVQLRAVPGLNLYRWLEVGPAIAMECGEGAGAHIDSMEWRVESDAGELVLSSRLPRCLSFDRYRTGIRASLLTATCSCGVAGVRIIPEDEVPAAD